MAGGEALATFLTELRRTVAAVKRSNDPAFGATGARLDEAITSLKRASAWLVAKLDDEPEAALAGATPYLRLFGLAGGGMLAEEALAALRLGGGANAGAAGRVALARFFAEALAVQAPALERATVDGAESVNAAERRARGMTPMAGLAGLFPSGVFLGLWGSCTFRAAVMYGNLVTGRLLGFDLGDWVLLMSGCLASGLLAFLM